MFKQGEGLSLREVPAGSAHLVSVRCFIGSEAMALSSQGSFSFLWSCFVSECRASRVIISLAFPHMFQTLASPWNKWVRSNIWLKAGWKFLSKCYWTKSKVWNSVFILRCNSAEFKLVCQCWVKSTEARVVFHIHKELTLTYCFRRFSSQLKTAQLLLISPSSV